MPMYRAVKRMAHASFMEPQPKRKIKTKCHRLRKGTERPMKFDGSR